MNWQPGMTLTVIEKQAITEALQHFYGNKTHAARALGICIRTMRNKIHEYGLVGLEYQKRDVENTAATPSPR